MPAQTADELRRRIIGRRRLTFTIGSIALVAVALVGAVWLPYFG